MEEELEGPVTRGEGEGQGKVEEIEGIWLYQIDLGSARFSNCVRIHVLLRNPEEMGKVLITPCLHRCRGIELELPSSVY